ncbi:MAG: hypothetical protein IJ740_08410 [Ruminococcus sp.]|nr:hypothetical protein [Ruminococcus sp.]
MADIILAAFVVGGITVFAIILIMAGFDSYDYKADENKNEEENKNDW